ncbi:MAG: hypothetical protein ACON46_04590 [Coraliomargaritaceae bacterium]
MEIVITRELLGNHKAVQSALAAGQSITWTSRGKVIAHLHPPTSGKKKKSANFDWVGRARSSGAINQDEPSAASILYADRD